MTATDLLELSLSIQSAHRSCLQLGFSEWAERLEQLQAEVVVYMVEQMRGTLRRVS